MSTTSSINSLLSSTSSTSIGGNSALDLGNMLASEAGVSTPGIDVSAAVAAAIYADRAPERIWQSDQTTLGNQQTALTSIQSATESLYTDLQNLNTLSGPLTSRSVYSSNSNYVTATATSGTTTGSHTVVVNQLATAGSWYSDSVSSPTATLPSSSMTITMASGPTATFQTGSGQAGDNLQDLASAINGANLGATAEVVTDSTGARLSIVANNTGTSGDFTVSSQDFAGTSWVSPVMPTGSTLGSNTLVLTVGSGASAVTFNVPTTSGETYADLASAINTQISTYNQTAASPVNITATTGTSGNGTDLTIASADGSEFSLNEPAVGFTQAVTGSDASATVDGVPVDSSSNTLTGAINGVTINLLGATQGSTINLDVQADMTDSATALNQFVTDYNKALNLVNSQFQLTTTTDSSGNASSSQGPLSGDSTVRSLQLALESAISYVAPSSSGSTSSVSTLSDIGITVNNDGTLAFDSSKLNSALVNSPSDVQNFFQGSALNGFAANFYNALNVYTDPADGAFVVDLQSISAQNSSLSQQISDFETGYIAAQQQTLLADFSSAEEALQSLPEQMQQLNSELGFTSKGN